jgi:hypothetical protein
MTGLSPYPPPLPEPGMVIFDHINRGSAVPWSDVLEALNHGNENVVFTLRLRPVDVEIEETDYNYEFRGIPLNLTEDMTLIDDSVVPDTQLVKQGVLPNPFVEASQSDNKEADPGPTYSKTDEQKRKQHIEDFFRAHRDEACVRDNGYVP